VSDRWSEMITTLPPGPAETNLSFPLQLMTVKVISRESQLVAGHGSLRSLSCVSPGDYSEGVTPVPIPNTAVKPLSPHGTARETWWESRPSPGSFLQKPLEVTLPEAFVLFDVLRFSPCISLCEVYTVTYLRTARQPLFLDFL
jgi:hypothetical protein